MYLLEILHSLTFISFMHIYVGKPKGLSSLIVMGFLPFKILLDQVLTHIFYTTSGPIFSCSFGKKEIFRCED